MRQSLLTKRPQTPPVNAVETDSKGTPPELNTSHRNQSSSGTLPSRGHSANSLNHHRRGGDNQNNNYSNNEEEELDSRQAHNSELNRIQAELSTVLLTNN